MLFRYSLSAAFLFLLATIWACGPSQSDLAGKKLILAQSLLSKGDTLNSLLQFDSIPKLYPEAGAEARRAVRFSNEIYTGKLIRQRDILAATKPVIAALTGEFIPEKGEFDKTTNYFHIRQGIDKSWSRSFIQVYLNEKGELSLVSNYYGEQWINHTSFRVDGFGISLKTDSVPLDNLNNHHSEFSGAKWEKVTYRGTFADSVVSVIASNQDKKLKAIFRGKGYYVIWIEDPDKKAIKAAFDLSKALKAKSKSELMIAELESRIKPDK